MIVFCHNCGRDLRKTRPKKVPTKYLYTLQAAEWFEKGLTNGYFLIDNQKVHSLWIFQTFSNLYTLLRSLENLNLSSFPLLKEFHSLRFKLRKYKSKKASPIYENLLLTAMIYHLFQNFPENFQVFISENDLTHRNFVHGFTKVPFWYLQTIDKLIPPQNTVSREISESEVIGAVNYLKQIGEKVTQQSVAAVVGCHFSIHKGFVQIYHRL